MKLKGFTIMEVVVTMIIMSIVISFSVLIYQNIHLLHNQYQISTRQDISIQQLDFLLHHDISKADKIIKTPLGFQCTSDSLQITYTVSETHFIRFQAGKIDTFDIQCEEKTYTMNNKEVAIHGYIDAIALQCVYKEQLLQWIFKKEYASSTLIHAK